MIPLGSVRARTLVVLLLAAVVAGLAARLAFARGSATSSPSAGVVVIDTSLGYQQTAAAGTGMVLTPSGEVLTNNHVIRGATSIRVVVPGTGRSYRATVVGYGVTSDTAVLQLQHASGLATVRVGDSARLRVGQTVRAVGNAGGTGTLTTVRGRVTGIGKTITVSDDQGGTARLSALVETNAPLQPGDSGGPLVDSSGRVVSMDTAASVSGGFVFAAPANDAYAIPIDRALAIAKQIEARRSSASVHVGATPFVGISVASPDGYHGGGSSSGALVAGVFPGSPADKAGLAQGDQLLTIAGKTITSPNTIVFVLLRKKPGDTIALTWADPYGRQQSATLTLASGPPQ